MSISNDIPSGPLDDESIAAHVYPLSSEHLFQSAVFALSLPPVRGPALRSHPLSAALNLRHLQTAHAHKLTIPRVEELTMSCPSCGCIWIPGLNVKVRLVTYRTHSTANRLPTGIIHSHSRDAEASDEPEITIQSKQRRLSKRARRRKVLKREKKQKALGDKLQSKFGLDAGYVKTRAMALRRKEKVLAYGCDECHVYHIIEEDLTNQYPTSQASKPVNKRDTATAQQSSNMVPGEGSKPQSRDSSPQASSNNTIPSNSPKAEPKRTVNKPSSKSKQKNSLQKLIAKQKETKAQQQSTSGLGLLGLLAKK